MGSRVFTELLTGTYILLEGLLKLPSSKAWGKLGAIQVE